MSESESSPAFVISSPRSGSTWLKQALNAHPEIFCTENRLFGSHFDVVRGLDDTSRLRVTLDAYVDALLQPFNTRDLDATPGEVREELLGVMANAIMLYARERSGKRIVVDKVTPYLDTAEAVVQAITRHFPDAPIVYLVRDGRDVLTSGVFHWLTKAYAGDHASDHQARRRRLFVDGDTSVQLDRFFTDDEIDTWTTYWRQPLQTIGLARESHRVRIMKYESMSEDFVHELEALFTFLNASPASNFVAACVERSSFRSMSGGRERGDADPTAHVRKGVVGDWRQYFTRADGERFHAQTGAQMIATGYVNDESWIDDLPETLGPV